MSTAPEDYYAHDVAAELVTEVDGIERDGWELTADYTDVGPGHSTQLLTVTATGPGGKRKLFGVEIRALD
jgi:hypothetical protein